MKTVLTIAGFDPSSGAGITADLMVFAAHGLFGTSAITALTVQNTLGVYATQAVAADTVTATLTRLYEDLPPAGIKIGMLANAEVVSAVAAFLARIRGQSSIPVVLDPVLKSSSGKDLLDDQGRQRLLSELLPHIDWITPNRGEVAELIPDKFSSESSLISKAKELQQQSEGLNVIVTAGDQEPPSDLVLLRDQLPYFVEGTHIRTACTHGTGCAFSSALLSRLVLGDSPQEAVQSAKAYITEALRLAEPRGLGHGPPNHLWPLTGR